MPACASELIQDVLRDEFGFEGAVASDCGAVSEIFTTHAYADDLRAETYTEVNASPKADVHQREWRKIMNGDPGELLFYFRIGN